MKIYPQQVYYLFYRSLIPTHLRQDCEECYDVDNVHKKILTFKEDWSLENTDSEGFELCQ